jgi:hypothetical protein
MKKIIDYIVQKLDRHQKRVHRAVLKLKFLSYQIEFGERDSDIYIVTYPKSGTTLMQMLLYQLTTDGNMDFDHIYDVSPWIKNDSFLGNKPKDLPSPRLIKSHDKYRDFPADIKGKFIFVHREGKDCAVSNWHQEINYRTTTLNFDEYLLEFINKDYNWFVYTMDWMENKNNLPILYLRYEDLINDFNTCLSKIIKFLELDKSQVDVNRVYERTRIEFMKAHESKFGNKETKADKVYNEFIRKGKAGEGAERFPEKFAKAFDKAYLEYITPLEKNIKF